MRSGGRSVSEERMFFNILLIGFILCFAAGIVLSDTKLLTSGLVFLIFAAMIYVIAIKPTDKVKKAIKRYEKMMSQKSKQES